ncbi:MAG TPA: LysE family transporter [Stellaceae bacterium]|jgi:threonine/homoserine/homoserine lactone efflux protein
MLLLFFLKGIVVGAVIAVPVGPVGILCLRRTIFEGRLSGLVSGVGAATADALFGAVAAFGLSFVSDWLLGYQTWLRAGGGVYLLYSGGSALLSQAHDKLAEESDPETLFRDFASAFALTITNPVTILVFLAIFAALGLGGARAALLRAALLVIGVWIGSFLWWLVLSSGVELFRRSIEPRHLAWVSRGSGLILFLTGAALLASIVVDHLI